MYSTVNFQFNWTAIVDTLLSTAGLSEQDRSTLRMGEMPVNIQCHEFLPELTNLIATTPRRLSLHQSPKIQSVIIVDYPSIIEYTLRYRTF